MDGKSDLGGAACMVYIASGLSAAFYCLDQVMYHCGTGWPVLACRRQGNSSSLIITFKPEIRGTSFGEDGQSSLLAGDFEILSFPVRSYVGDDAVIHSDLGPGRRIRAAALVVRTGVVDKAAHPNRLRVPEQSQSGVIPVTTVVYGVPKSESDKTANLSHQVTHVFAQIDVGGAPAPVEGEEERRVFTSLYDTVHFGKRCRQRPVAEYTSNSRPDSSLDLIGVHGLACGDAEQIGTNLLKHTAVVVIGADITPHLTPASGKLFTGLCAVVEDGYDLSFTDGVKGGGKVMDG